MVEDFPERRGGLDEQVPELGGRRPGEVGAGRLRLRARRFPRRGPLARATSTCGRPARRKDLYECIEWAAASPGQRQGRAQRHLLLRDEPVARRRAPAAAPRGDLPVGGRGRLVPRDHPPRRHPERFLRQAGIRGRSRACSTASASAARGAASPASPWRARDAARRGAGAQPRSTSATTSLRRIRSRTPTTATARPDWSKVTVPMLSAANWGGQGLHLARQLRGLRARGLDAEVARAARHRALDALLHRLRRRAAEAVLRPLPEGRGQRLGRAAAGACCRSATSTSGSSSATRTSGRWPGPSGRGSISTRRARRSRATPPRPRASVTYDPLGDGLTFRTAPLAEETEITGPVAAKLFVSSASRGRRPLPGAARVRPRRRGGALPGRARPAHADRAGLAARLAPQARPRR